MNSAAPKSATASTRTRDATKEPAYASAVDRTQTSPNSARAWAARGRLAFQTGRHEDAECSFARAIEFEPHQVRWLVDHALVLNALGRSDQGLERCEQALALQPNWPPALERLASCTAALGQRDRAIEALSQRVTLAPPAPASVHLRLGALLFEQGRLDRALSETQTACERAPDFFEAWSNLSNFSFIGGQLELARRAAQRGLQLRPGAAPLHAHLANLCLLRNDAASALEHLDRADACAATGHDYRHLRADALARMGDHRRAEVLLRQQLNETDRADAWAALAQVLFALDRDRAARDCVEQALARQPGLPSALHTRSLLDRADGHERTARRDYEARLAFPENQWRRWRYPGPRYEGQKARDASVLLHAEQGLGDQLEMTRWLERLTQRVGRVLYDGPAALERLIGALPGVEYRVQTGPDQRSQAFPDDYDYQLPVCSLPLVLGGDEASLASPPHVVAPQRSTEPALDDAIAELRTRAGELLRVGLVWAGNPAHERDAQRSLPLKALKPLTELSGVQLVSLQYGRAASSPTVREWGLRTLHPWLHDLGDTARVVDALDLVISVDTSVAHLAGCLGRETWLLLPRPCDPRWGKQGRTTRLYPSLRLFRQAEPGDWQSVIEAVRAELEMRVRVAGHHLADHQPKPAEPPAEPAPPQAAATLAAQATSALRAARVEQAIKLFGRALAIAPEWTAARSNLAVALTKFGQPERAMAELKRCTEDDPTNATAWNNLGNAQYRAGRYAEAYLAHRRALELDASPTMVHTHLLADLQALGRSREALELERRLVAGDASARAHLLYGSSLLRLGHFREGWHEYEARRALPSFRGLSRCSAPDWQGEPLAGKHLLVYAEQGHGDTIQFARYVPQLATRSARLTFAVQPALVRWFERAFSDAAFSDATLSDAGSLEDTGSRLRIVSGTAAVSDVDYQVPLLSLPRLTGREEFTSARTIPRPWAPRPSSPEVRAQWEARLASAGAAGGDEPNAGTRSKLRVGLAWAGNPGHEQDAARSLDPTFLAPLLATPGFDFVSLQLGANPQAAVDADAESPPLIDVRNWIADFADTAELAQCLDLVITVDTALAHLAGSTNVPTWVLLAARADWRWLTRRNDAAWYPSVQLFRQAHPGAWPEVIATIQTELVLWRDGQHLQPTQRARLAEARAALDRGDPGSSLAILDALTAHGRARVAVSYLRGLALRELGRLEQAQQAMGQVLHEFPDWIELVLAHSQLQRQRGLPQQALQSLDRAIRSQSHGPRPNASVTRELARIHAALGEPERWVELLASIAQSGADFETALALATTLAQQRKLDEAERQIEIALAWRPDSAEALAVRGQIAHFGGDAASAIECYDESLRQEPHNAGVLTSLGNALESCGRFPDALAAHEAAVRADPGLAEARHNLALALLAAGDYERGFAEYEARLTTRMAQGKYPNLPGKAWRGEPLRGKSLLVCDEQGYGDSIQCTRFLPQLRELAAKVWIKCPPALKSLFESSFDGIGVLVPGAPLPDCDYHCFTFSLPHRLGISRADAITREPYLKTDAQEPNTELDRKLRGLAAVSGPKVGVCWAGNPSHAADRQRSLSSTTLSSLLHECTHRTPSIHWVTLQPGVSSSTSDLPSNPAEHTALGPLLSDFSMTTRALAHLDLVLCVDTALAHLCGALAVPCWVMLPTPCDWRWGRDGESCTWYSSVHLFRQHESGDWSRVIAEVASELAARWR